MTDPLEEMNRQLSVVRDRVRGVALGHHTGFYLCGRAGSSKTYTVRKTLEEAQQPYHYHDGHITPIGLFELLSEQYDRVIVLDDVSAIFQDKIAVQILLAALGNQPDELGARVVKYRRKGSEDTIHFSGGIIMISNLRLHSGPVLQALKSRVHYLPYDPTDEQIIALMRAIAARGWRSLSPKDCLEVAEFLIGQSRSLNTPLDLRMLVDKAFPDFLQYRNGDAETHWKDLIRITLREQVIDLTHTAQAKLSRQATKEKEQVLVRKIMDAYESKQDRITAWTSMTNKSERAFYRRVEELGL
jgi:hypothetical protein